MSKEHLSEPKTTERRSWVWIMLMVNIVFLVLLMTLGILALRVGNYLPEDTDILFVVGKSPSVEFGDGESNSWQSGKNVNIFQASYVNGEGVTTVVSQDGTSLIAPGTQSTYRFSMYNNGNMAVVYQTDLDFTFKIGGLAQAQYQFPLKVRLYTQNGDYLIGGESTWVNVSEAVVSAHVSQLGASSFETFTVELMWQFEGGNDELDTLYGDTAVDMGVSLTLGINTYAEEHIDPTAKGGTPIDGAESQEAGGTVRVLWLVLLLIFAAILVFYVAWLMHKRLRKW
ncbi:MAG: hypothetical protein IKC35_05385 [Clostridia bacterium]|nr:hypothetical protein [Clostridia bacterium]